MSRQKTRHQKLTSYWVMNSLRDKICLPACYRSLYKKEKPKSTLLVLLKMIMHSL